jgi:choline kinase
MILAGGNGTRLKPYTNDKPKALVKVNDKELLGYVLDFINKPKVDRILVVTGYYHELTEKYVAEYHSGIKIDVIKSPHYTKGSITALVEFLDFIDDDFLLMNADHIYPHPMYEKIIKNNDNITAICDFDRMLGTDDMKIATGSDGYLEKISKTLDEYDGGYIGMTYVPRKKIQNYKEGVLETFKKHGDKAPVEWVLGCLAANGEKIAIGDCSHIGWIEIDTPEELKIAEDRLKDKDLHRKLISDKK